MNERDQAEIGSALRAALLDALERLAPIGGERALQFNAASDALVGVLAQVLSALPASEADVDRLCLLFREKSIASLAERAAAKGRRH